MSRERCERQLLAYAAKVGSTDFLRKEQMGPSFFHEYHDEAVKLFKLQETDGFLPTVQRLTEATDPKTEKRYFENLDFSEAPDERDVPDYKRELRQHHGQDVYLEKMAEAKQAWKDGNWDEIPQKMNRWAQEIQAVLVPNQVMDLTADAAERYNYFQERSKAAIEGTWLTQFAHPEMNEFIGGYQPGDLVTYVSRPGVGKTFSIVLDAFHCWSNGASVLFVSMETDQNQIGFRFDALHSQKGEEPGFSTYNLRKGLAVKVPDLPPSEKRVYATDETAQEYYEYIERLREMRKRGECPPFYVVTPKNAQGRITPSYIEALARELNVDIVFVDYMGLVPSDTGQKEERFRLAEVSWAFKEAAVRLNIPFVVPHQMNRETEKAKEINVANFAGSDAVGQNVDVGIYITKEENVVKYQLLKVRGGPSNRRFAWVWDYDTGIRRTVSYFASENDVDDVEEGTQSYSKAIPSETAARDLIWNAITEGGDEDGSDTAEG